MIVLNDALTAIVDDTATKRSVGDFVPRHYMVFTVDNYSVVDTTADSIIGYGEVLCLLAYFERKKTVQYCIAYYLASRKRMIWTEPNGCVSYQVIFKYCIVCEYSYASVFPFLADLMNL